jgi:hypothetical protein
VNATPLTRALRAQQGAGGVRPLARLPRLLSKTEPNELPLRHGRKSPLDQCVWITAPKSSNTRIFARCERERERYFAYATA